MMNRMTSIVAAAVVCGCVAHPAVVSRPLAVPDERILSRQWLRPAAYTGPVDIARDIGHGPEDCGSEISIDAVVTAILRPGERLRLYLRPGDHLLTTKAVAVPAAYGSAPICFGGLADAVVPVGSAAAASYRLFLDGSGEMHIAADSPPTP